MAFLFYCQALLLREKFLSETDGLPLETLNHSLPIWCRALAADANDQYPDKRALFLASLQHYLETVTSNNLHYLERGEKASESIRSFFLRLIAEPASEGYSASGCLLTNTAVELGGAEEDVAALVRQAFSRVEEALRRRLTEARTQGDLSPDVEPEKLAKHLLVLIQGVRVMSRLGVEKRLLKQAVESALQQIK